MSTLPAEVADVTARYEALNADASPSEVRAVVQDIVSDLEALINDEELGCAVRFYAHASIAQIVAFHTDRTNTDQIAAILAHLAAAVALGLDCDEVPTRSVRIAQSNQGTWLGQVADQLDPDDVERVTADSERTLRAVLADSIVGTSENVMRAFNLAAHLLATGDKARSSEALELLQTQEPHTHLLGSVGERDYLRQCGNARRRAAHHVDDATEAIELRQSAMDYYHRVEATTPQEAPTTLYAEIALLMSESGADLDDIIDTARSGLERVDIGDPYHREASLQLAEFYLDRYDRDRHPADADHAESLSFGAVNSYYTRKGSFEQRGHLLRRLAILETTANRTGNSLDRYVEILEIAERTGHELTGGLVSLEKTAKSAKALVGYSRGASTLDQLVDALGDNLAHARFFGIGNDRAARIAEAVEQVANAIGRVQFHGESLSQLDDLIQDAHSAASQAALELDPSRPDDEFYVAQARGHLALAQACAFGNHEIMAQAASLLAHAITTGQRQDMATSTLLPALSIAHKAATFAGDLDAVGNYAVQLISRISEFDEQQAINQTPESVVLRERLVAPEIGPVALNGQTPQEVAWRIALLRDTYTAMSMADWIQTVENTSFNATFVFIAQSMQTCSAVVVTDRQWTTIEVPDGNAERFSPALRQLTAASRNQAPLDQRRKLQDTVMTITKDTLADLAATLPQDRPILLTDTGIMHWLPVAGALVELCPTTPGVVSLDRPATPFELNPTTHLDTTGIVVAPGNEVKGGPSYLPRALDDADFVEDTFAGSGQWFEPDLETTLNVIRSSSTVFFINHGEANIRSPLDSRLDLGEKFTARHALQLNGNSPTLAVLASCESFGLDADVAEARFGIGTAMLRTGTRAVIDCMWTVTDDIASNYTRELAQSLANGLDIITAHGGAIRSVKHASQHFQLRTAGIPQW